MTYIHTWRGITMHRITYTTHHFITLHTLHETCIQLNYITLQCMASPCITYRKHITYTHHAHIHIYIYTYMHTCIHTHIHTCILYIHAYVATIGYINLHTYMLCVYTLQTLIQCVYALHHITHKYIGRPIHVYIAYNAIH